MDEKNEKIIIKLDNGSYIVQLLNQHSLESTLKEMNAVDRYKVYPGLKHKTTSFVLRDKDHHSHMIFDNYIMFDKFLENAENKLEYFEIKIIRDADRISQEDAELLIPVFRKLNWSPNVLYYALNKVEDEESRLHDVTRLPHGFVSKHHFNLKYYHTNEKIVLPINMKVKGNMYINIDNIELPPYLEVENQLIIESNNVNIKLPHGLNVASIKINGKGSIRRLGNDTIIREFLALSERSISLPENIKLGKNININNTNIEEFPENSLSLDVGDLIIKNQNFNKLPTNKLEYHILALEFEEDQELKEKIPENISVEKLVLVGVDASKIPNVLNASHMVLIKEVKEEIDLSNWSINKHINLHKTSISKLPRLMNLDTLFFRKTEIKEMSEKLIISDYINLTQTKINKLPEITFVDTGYGHQFILDDVNIDEIPAESLIGFKGRIVLSNMEKFPKLPDNLHPDTRVHLISYLDTEQENVEPITPEEYNKLYFSEGTNAPKI